MFGYMRVNRPELKVREEALYKALYCGQCKAQKVCTGHCSRLTLSYDFVFLALVRMVLTNEDAPRIQMKRCMIHPFRRRPIADRTPTLDFCAYAGALLTYHKIEDDRLDEKGSKRLRANLFRPWAKGARKRALRASDAFAELDKQISADLEAIHELERTKLPTADRPAEQFGSIMAAILSVDLDPASTQVKIANHIGRHVGRWVYLIDALDDYEEDRKKGRYNPFVCLYGQEPLTDEHREQIRMALYREIAGLQAAVDLLEPDEGSDLAGLLYNVVNKGLPWVTEEVLAGRFQAKQKPSKEDKRRKKKGTMA